MPCMYARVEGVRVCEVCVCVRMCMFVRVRDGRHPHESEADVCET